ncbi:Rv0361 family membrane protein [Micromonospora sp. NBC_00821]|uniref:Rv0361 family membrane protein n=1 Tax=Micromonospora sp. NBC_00821 TaxID=2975977 RepID=UPI003FA5C66D
MPSQPAPAPPPGQLALPASPAQPALPAAPTSPAFPGQPSGISQPAFPGQPAGAGQPAFPGQPAGAGQPAFPGQPAGAGQPEAPGGPTSAAASTQPGAPNSSSIPPAPPAYPPYPGTAAPKKKRGLLIAAIALVVIMVLCVGGGVVAFLTLRDAETGEGAKEPAVAVDEFLTAVYKDRDATKAADHVCAASRDDDKIAAKVAEVEKYASTYQNPRFRWTTPKVDNQTGERATVSTRLTMTTADEKVADQELRFTVVQKTGWWVCEVA